MHYFVVKLQKHNGEVDSKHFAGTSFPIGNFFTGVWWANSRLGICLQEVGERNNESVIFSLDLGEEKTNSLFCKMRSRAGGFLLSLLVAELVEATLYVFSLFSTGSTTGKSWEWYRS